MKHHPNSKHFKDKADRLWSFLVREIGRCEICSKEGRPDAKGRCIVGLDAHHLIPRANLRYRWDAQNGVSLCKSHHGAHPHYRNHTSAAHGSGEVYERFKTDLAMRDPVKFNYWQQNKDDRRPMENYTYQEVCDILASQLKEL